MFFGFIFFSVVWRPQDVKKLADENWQVVRANQLPAQISLKPTVVLMGHIASFANVDMIKPVIEARDCVAVVFLPIQPNDAMLLEHQLFTAYGQELLTSFRRITLLHASGQAKTLHLLVIGADKDAGEDTMRGRPGIKGICMLRVLDFLKICHQK